MLKKTKKKCFVFCVEKEELLYFVEKGQTKKNRV